MFAYKNQQEKIKDSGRKSLIKTFNDCKNQQIPKEYIVFLQKLTRT